MKNTLLFNHMYLLVRRARKTGYTTAMKKLVVDTPNAIMVFRFEKEAKSFGPKGISMSNLHNHLDAETPGLVVIDNAALLELFQTADHKISQLEEKCDRYKRAIRRIKDIADDTNVDHDRE